MKIKVVSPTHIGSGSRYAVFDYIFKNGKVRIIDYEKAYVEDVRVRKLIDSGRFDPKVVSHYKYEIDSFCEPSREILEHIKIGGKPYIPGSSLKGTIRTAILWKYLKDNNKKIKSRKELDNVEKEFFREAYDDFMKFLLVRDTDTVSIDKLGVYEILVLTEREENGQVYMEPKPKRRTYLESLKPGTELNLEIKIIKKLKSTERKLAYLTNWTDVVAEFSKHIVEIELRFFKDRNQKGEFDELLNFIENVKSEIDSGEILFRLGHSTGWLWKTIGSLLTSKERIEVANKLKLNRGKKGRDFPKTRRVVLENKKEKKYKWLPGWIKVSH